MANAESLQPPHDECSPERRRFDQLVARILNSWLRRERTYLIDPNNYSLIADPMLQVGDIDSVPLYSNIDKILLDQADGFILSNPATGTVRIDFAPPPPPPAPTTIVLGNGITVGALGTGDNTVDTIRAIPNTGIQADISGVGTQSTLQLLEATPSQWGAVTTTTQTFGGDKNFNDKVAVVKTVSSDDHYICNSLDGITGTQAVGKLLTYEGGIVVDDTTDASFAYTLNSYQNSVSSYTTSWTALTGFSGTGVTTAFPLMAVFSFEVEIQLDTGGASSIEAYIRFMESTDAGGTYTQVSGTTDLRIAYTPNDNVLRKYTSSGHCVFTPSGTLANYRWRVEYKFLSGSGGSASGGVTTTHYSLHEIR